MVLKVLPAWCRYAIKLARIYGAIGMLLGRENVFAKMVKVCHFFK